MKKNFSIQKAVSYGFNIAKKKFLFFLGVLLILFLVNVFPEGFTTTKGEISFPTFPLLSILGIILQIIVGLGLISVALKIYDEKKVEYADLFRKYKLFFSFLIASILYVGIVLVGIILLIIPGIIWSIKYQYYSYFIVDKDMGPIEALKASGKITSGVKWKLFLFKIVLGLVNLAGLLLFVVGLLITIPTTFLAEAYVFRKLSSK